MKQLIPLLFLFSLPLAAQTTFFTESWYYNFGSNWRVEAGYPANANSVLADANNDVPTRLVYSGTPAADHSVTSSLVCNTNSSNWTFLLIHYLRDDPLAGYYEVDFIGQAQYCTGYVVLYKVVGGVKYQLAWAWASVGTMQSMVVGSQITVTMNGQQLFSVPDSSLTTGTLGVGTNMGNYLDPTIGIGGTLLAYFDHTAPNAPTNLTATATSSRINLTWTAPWDDSHLPLTYNIYRGGTNIGSSNTTSYSDITVAPAQTYSYTVTAVDLAGREGAASSPLSVTAR